MNDQPVTSHDAFRTIIAHARDNTITDLGGSEEHGTLAPDGGHDFQKTQVRRETLDGYVLKEGEVALRCTKCGSGPWSHHVMARCTGCQLYVCIGCRKQMPAGPLCVLCAKAVERAARIQFFRSIR